MSSIVSSITGGNGAGMAFKAQSAPIVNTTSQGQVDEQYGNTSNAIANQQSFVNAVNGQNGLGNQSNVFNQLQGVANGSGPNPAQAQLAQATGSNVANQAALMAGQRGSNANAGLMARQAAMQGANTQQQAAGQAATLQATQSLNALNSMGSIATNQVNQQANAANALASSTQNEQANIFGAAGALNNANVANTSNMNNANATVAADVAKAQSNMMGNMMGGLGSATSMFGGGKSTPGAPGGGADGGSGALGDLETDGTDVSGGAADSLGGAGSEGGDFLGGVGTGSDVGGITDMTELFTAQGGLLTRNSNGIPVNKFPKKYSDGGDVDDDEASTPVNVPSVGTTPALTTPNPSGPKSNVGKAMMAQDMSNSTKSNDLTIPTIQLTAAGAMANQAAGMAGTAMKAGEAAGKWALQNASNLVDDAGEDVADFGSEAGTDIAGGADALGAGAAEAAPEVGEVAVMAAAKGGRVKALFSPGEKYLAPKDVEKVKKGANPMEVGKTVPGKRKAKGPVNSYADDTVPANPEVGGIVLPNSVTQSKNPQWAAHKFVSAIMKEQSLKKGK